MKRQTGRKRTSRKLSRASLAVGLVLAFLFVTSGCWGCSCAAVRSLSLKAIHPCCPQTADARKCGGRCDRVAKPSVPDAIVGGIHFDPTPAPVVQESPHETPRGDATFLASAGKPSEPGKIPKLYDLHSSLLI